MITKEDLEKLSRKSTLIGRYQTLDRLTNVMQGAAKISNSTEFMVDQIITFMELEAHDIKDGLLR
jgi:hypothetical protein